MIVFLNQKVADFNAWKQAFIADEDTRRAAGIAGHRVFAVLGRPQAIVIELDIVDPDKASRYLASASFQAAMRRAGGLGQAEVLWGAEIEAKDLHAPALRQPAPAFTAPADRAAA
jgi:hypothetical protein